MRGPTPIPGARSMPEPDPPPILLFPDPHLRAKARPVGPGDADAVRDLAPRMLESMYRAPGIGLAAPQVGVGLRLVVVDLQRDEQRAPVVLVNPEADGLLAACLQHEVDHLDGVLFVDHLSPLKRNMILRRIAKERKQKERA
jgi:peptide deformylase